MTSVTSSRGGASDHAARSPSLRSLREPRALHVRTDRDGHPVAVRGRRGYVPIVAVRERWRIDDEWWRHPISRSYHEVVLESGRVLTLYLDRTDGRWYLQG